MKIENFTVEIIRKNIKNVNLKVYPNLKIKITAPIKTDINTIKRLVVSKEKWINSKLKFYEEQNRLSKREYVSGEDHYLNGKRFILKVVDSNTPHIEKTNSKLLTMYVRKNSSYENKEKVMYSFYKEELQKKIAKIIYEQEQIIGVKVNKIMIRKMKNKWGSCNQGKKQIIFNTELAKKKDSEIRYVIIHELIHLIEEKHNDNFKKLLNIYCPKWELYNKSLNFILIESKTC